MHGELGPPLYILWTKGTNVNVYAFCMMFEASIKFVRYFYVEVVDSL